VSAVRPWPGWAGFDAVYVSEVSIVNRQHLAELLGKTEVTVHKWSGEGLPIRSRGGPGISSQYDTAEVVGWMIQRALAGERSESGRERRDRLEADRLELQIAKEVGELLDAREIEPLWAEDVATARAAFTESAVALKAKLDAAYGLDVDVGLLQA
jgi:phage terminase Nu1 subunit (DNA packaging protein)